MAVSRYLLIVADDFGIGPETSRGILDLAERGVVTGTVLLVNSPYAEQAVRAWREAGSELEIGWHPCLTLDSPVLPPGRVPSLVDPQGRFRKLPAFLGGLLMGRVQQEDLRAELQAQYQRFLDLVGQPPGFMNGHHHVHIFPPVKDTLRDLLQEKGPLPYLRRVSESWRSLAKTPGGRIKRLFLNSWERRGARRQNEAGFPGNDGFAGVAGFDLLKDPDSLANRLRNMPGQVVEWCCHPGHPDPTLNQRDGWAHRFRELQMLRLGHFQEACRRANFKLVSPSQAMRDHHRGGNNAA